MVTSPNNEIITIIEIEERPSTPKKIIGDIMTLALCNRFYIKQNGEPQDFKITHDTRLVVAGITPPEGSKLPQLCNIIPRLKRFTSPDDGINLQNLNYIFREDINTTLEALKKYMQEIFP